jgi:CDP-paratose 2-epimerase
MNVAIVTGANGLIGSETVMLLSNYFDKIIGIDNDMRAHFFGSDSSVESTYKTLIKTVSNFENMSVDIRNYNSLKSVFSKYRSDIKLIIHTAAQPSHDWAVKEPFSDYHINSTGTLNLLELTRMYCKETVFIYTSTNKVYGDNSNYLPFIELDTRYELPPNHIYYSGIDESLSIDFTKHSLFGCSKLSADVYVQEYGRYFDMNTTVLRGGCLTGSKHKGAELHGFLNYLVRCILEGKTYKIIGHKGKQVRDNIHAVDVASACLAIYNNPRKGEVYNIGGGRHSNCSILEAITIIEEITGLEAKTEYIQDARIGDHIWWISDMTKFRTHFPNWEYTYTLKDTIVDIINNKK